MFLNAVGCRLRVGESDKMCSFRIYAFKSCCGCLSLRTGCYIATALQFMALLSMNILPNGTEQPILGNLAALAFIGFLINATFRQNHTHLRWWLIMNNSFVLVMAFVFIAFEILLVLRILPESLVDHPENMAFLMCASSEAVTVAIIITHGLSSWMVFSYICELREQETRGTANGDNIAPPVIRMVPV